MGQLLFLHRSLAYRNAASEMMRKARRLPQGPERNAARRCALALRDLARTEAWLEGRTAERPRSGVLREAEGVRWSNRFRAAPSASHVRSALSASASTVRRVRSSF